MLISYVARLATTVVHGWLHGRQGLLEEFVLPMRVWPADIDAYGHLNNGRFLTLMDMGRWSYGIRTPLFRESLKRKWRPVLAAATVQFRRELGLFKSFNLVTRLAHWDERSFYFEHRLERGDTLYARAFVRGVTKAGTRRVSPAEMLEVLGHREPPPAAPPELTQWIASWGRPALADPVVSQT